MSEIPIVTIINKLTERVPLQDAEILLAKGLEALGLPVRKSYTPEEVAAIGMAISRSVMGNLAAMADPLARDVGRGVGQVLDVVQGHLDATLQQARKAASGPLKPPS